MIGRCQCANLPHVRGNGRSTILTIPLFLNDPTRLFMLAIQHEISNLPLDIVRGVSIWIEKETLLTRNRVPFLPRH
jgi:hypothetical protein